MRYLVCTLWLIILSLLPDCMTSDYAHEYDHYQPISASEHSSYWAPQSLVTTEIAFYLLSSKHDSSPISHQYYQHHNRDMLALVSCRRTSLHDDVQCLNFEPDYHLLIAFLSPPLRSLAWLITPLPQDSFGKLKSQRVLYHLFGRNEANLLYTFRHGREYLTKDKQRKQKNMSRSDMDTHIFT